MYTISTMHRAIFKKGKQTIFIDSIRKKSGLSSGELARKCNVCGRTFRDWGREKYSLPYDSLKKLCRITNIEMPRVKILPEYWHIARASKLGGKRHFELYGSPGTPSGRRLGGFHSLETHYKFKTGFIRSKKIVLPRKTENLAELFGIILGDGGVNKYQLTISLNWRTDHSYYLAVKKLIEKLFGLRCLVLLSGSCVSVIASSVRLIDFLVSNGLKIGNKVAKQVDVPEWIKKNKKFSRRCVRGLIDTDGCVYFERHKYKRKLYKNICLNFSNRSMPLLKFVSSFLNRHAIKAKLNQCSVKVGRAEDIKKYFKLIGSSNQKHLNKYNAHINTND